MQVKHNNGKVTSDKTNTNHFKYVNYYVPHKFADSLRRSITSSQSYIIYFHFYALATSNSLITFLFHIFSRDTIMICSPWDSTFYGQAFNQLFVGIIHFLLAFIDSWHSKMRKNVK